MNPEIMEKCERIYQRHPAEVVIGRKTARELVDYAKEFLDLKAVAPLEQFTPQSMDGYTRMMQTYFDSIPTLKGKTPEFEVYLVAENEKSAKYYEKWDFGQYGDIFLWVELHTAFFQSNSHELSTVLSRLRGIEKGDLDGRTTEFAMYIFDSFPEDADNPVYGSSKE